MRWYTGLSIATLVLIFAPLIWGEEQPEQAPVSAEESGEPEQETPPPAELEQQSPPESLEPASPASPPQTAVPTVAPVPTSNVAEEEANTQFIEPQLSSADEEEGDD